MSFLSEYSIRRAIPSQALLISPIHTIFRPDTQSLMAAERDKSIFRVPPSSSSTAFCMTPYMPFLTPVTQPFLLESTAVKMQWLMGSRARLDFLLKRLQLRLCKRRFICPFFRRAFLSVTCSYFSTFKPSLAEEHFLEQSNTLSHTFSCNFHEAYRFLWDIFSLSNRRLRGRKRSSKFGERKGSLCTRLEHVLASIIPDDTEFIPERRMNSGACIFSSSSLKFSRSSFPRRKCQIGRAGAAKNSKSATGRQDR